MGRNRGLLGGERLPWYTAYSKGGCDHDGYQGNIAKTAHPKRADPGDAGRPSRCGPIWRKTSRSSNTGRKLKNKARRQSVHVLCRLAVLPGFIGKNQPVSPCVSAGSGASSRRLSTGRIAMRETVTVTIGPSRSEIGSAKKAACAPKSAGQTNSATK